MIRRALVVGLMMGCGCTADFVVGEDASDTASTGSTGSTTETSTTAETTSSSTAVDASAEGSTTMEPSSTSAAETSSTTGEPTTSESTTGPVGCRAFAYEPCADDPECIWDGIPENGVCVPHPCNEGNPQGGECWDALEGACNEMVQCEWVGDSPQCAPLLCEDCVAFGEPECMEIPQCVWNELEMMCTAL